MSDMNLSRSEPELTGLTPEYFRGSFGKRLTELGDSLNELLSTHEDHWEEKVAGVVEKLSRTRLVAKFAGLDPSEFSAVQLAITAVGDPEIGDGTQQK